MKFDLTDDDLRIIDMALQEVPYKYSAPVLHKLQAQVMSARAASENDAPAAPYVFAKDTEKDREHFSGLSGGAL